MIRRSVRVGVRRGLRCGPRGPVGHPRRPVLPVAGRPPLSRGGRDLEAFGGPAQRPAVFHDAAGQPQPSGLGQGCITVDHEDLSGAGGDVVIHTEPGGPHSLQDHPAVSPSPTSVVSTPSPGRGLPDGWRQLNRRQAGKGCSSGSTRRVHPAVPPLCRIGKALAEQLLELGARAAPQEQGHAPVALGLSAAGIGAAGWPRGGPAPASPGSGWFDTGHERDGEWMPAGAPVRRLLAGSRLGARPLGNSRARARHRPQLPGNDHELAGPGQVSLEPALREAEPGRHVPIPAARHAVKRPPARVAR